MVVPTAPEMEARLTALEREVRDLRARILELEQRIASLPEHPVDRAAVRDKTVYDWQGPR
ncbi:MAG: hypothetical protein L3K06_00190 [Thermoplasmata archaeon]|nr:hypothetical protein [Thermoplasmata archaeon]MCI4353768.1 hypothetical protein [Thermoplasmata archaeon]